MRESPANILLPICLLGYWTIIFLWERSIKTIKTITEIARIKIAIIKNVEIDPVLPCSKICASARGNSAIIPANIINETPLPIPREVICSPNQSKNITDPTNVTTVVTLKNKPGLLTSEPDAPEVPSKATANPYAWTVASKTVRYLVYWFIVFLPVSPSFLVETFAEILRSLVAIIDAEMYGSIVRQK